MLKWLFLDMNSFFASAEQHDNPALRARPCGVTPTEGEASGLIAVSVEAKATGVRNGMRPREARRMCPGFVAIKARPSRYVELHHQLRAATDKHAPITRVYSIDEWSVALVGKERTVEGSMELARRIKRQIADDLGPALRCSIGVSASRILAKTACELQKPDGLTVLPLEELPGAIAHLPVGKLPGIGPGMSARLAKHGVRDVPSLWRLSVQEARAVWGSVDGERWWRGFHGEEAPEPPTQTRSMGHAHVLPPKYRNAEDAYGILIRLLCKAAVRTRVGGYWAHGLHAFVDGAPEAGRWDDAARFPAVQDTPTLVSCLGELWRNAGAHPATRRPKRIGVELFGLTPHRSASGLLFPEAERPRRLGQAMDQINQRFGSHAIHPGAMHGIAGYAMDDKIAFGRVPEGDVLGM
ncbi:MAG: type VI secretion protein ImpB [Planctomycetota bacterium]